MACPGGCTNGGGQVKVQEVEEVRVYEGVQEANEDAPAPKPGPKEQKEWLARVDEAYFSGSDSGSDSDDEANARTNGHSPEHDVVDGISRSRMKDLMAHWASITGVDQQKLIYTSYIKVESDVGKKKQSDMERVAGLAVTAGGGW
jgi:hypothetical protein